MMNKYGLFIGSDPWKSINEPSYPQGHRLFRDDERFMVSMNDNGQRLFFIDEYYDGNITFPDNLAGIEIDLIKYTNNSQRLVCTLLSSESEIESKFSLVAKDIAAKCKGLSGRLLFSRVVELLRSWSSFLKPQRVGLSEAEYIGLWGELYTLSKVILVNFPPEDAMRFWVGPEGKKQDFTLNTLAIEVKTSLTSDARKMTISSLEQLEKITDQLFIFHVIANPSESSLGLSLSDLYNECRSRIGSDFLADLAFIKKVFDIYGKASDRQLNSKNLLISETLYEVTESFPCLRYGDVPDAVADLRYDLLVSLIRDFSCSKSIEEAVKNG